MLDALDASIIVSSFAKHFASKVRVMPQPDDRPRIRDDLIFRQLDEEWVLYDPSGKQLHVMNRTAAVIWLCCTGERTADDIVDEVRDAFGEQAPREEVARDVAAVIDDFAGRGLLT